MRPMQMRGASAIYYFGKNGALLMDSAEGTYGQLWDHFGEKSKVDEVLLKTRVMFITHIHGDHQLGILKMIYERDSLLDMLPENERTKTFIVVPQPMISWMQTYVSGLKHANYTILIESHMLNPEKAFYY